MVQEIAEHEASWFVLHTWLLEEILVATLTTTIRIIIITKIIHSVGIFQVFIFSILLV